MRKMKINKVTEDTIKNLTENFANLSTDGAVYISKDSSGYEVFVGVKEYETTMFAEPHKKIEKINRFIYEGIRYNIINLTYIGYKAVNDCGDYYEVLIVDDAGFNYSLFDAVKNSIKTPGTVQQYKNLFITMEDFDDDGIDIVKVNDDYTFYTLEVSPFQLTEDYINRNVYC